MFLTSIGLCWAYPLGGGESEIIENNCCLRNRTVPSMITPAETHHSCRPRHPYFLYIIYKKQKCVKTTYKWYQFVIFLSIEPHYHNHFAINSLVSMYKYMIYFQVGSHLKDRVYVPFNYVVGWWKWDEWQVL